MSPTGWAWAGWVVAETPAYVDRSALGDPRSLVSELETGHGYVRLWESGDGWLLSRSVPRGSG
jgi:hypothetical protein